jgi:hypothetical protein
MLFLLAVWSYFKYWGGLADPNEDDAGNLEKRRISSFAESSQDE